MTEEVKRYSLCEDCWEMQAYEDGTFVAYEDYKDVIDAKDARIAELEKHLKWWGSYGIIEVMIRNPGIKSFVEEHEQRIADLERQLAEATTWRSPDTAPKDGTWFIGYYDTDKILGTRADTMCAKDDPYTWLTNEGFLVKHKTLVGWIPLPFLKKKEEG